MEDFRERTVQTSKLVHAAFQSRYQALANQYSPNIVYGCKVYYRARNSRQCPLAVKRGCSMFSVTERKFHLPRFGLFTWIPQANHLVGDEV